MGSFKGLKQVRRIVEDCIKNIKHPVYHIKVIGLIFLDVFSEGMYVGLLISDC